MKKDSGISDGKYKYYAFICYTHADFREAEKLHRKLQSYGLPNRLMTKYEGKSKRLIPVFLDNDELLPGSYKDRDETALSESKYLIVVCSRSLHEHDGNVNKEIEAFIDCGHSYDKIIPFIIGNDKNPEQNCFPSKLSELKRKDDNNIIGSNECSPSGKRQYKKALLKVVATVQNIDMFELINADRRRKVKKTAVAIAAALLCILLAFGFYSYITLTAFPFKVAVKVRPDGVREWSGDGIEAKAGDTVEVQIEFVNERGFLSGFLKKVAANNNLEIVSENVIIRSVLPDSIEYVEDSTVLYNSNYQEGVGVVENSLVTTGINVGSYLIGGNAYVRFKGVVTDAPLANEDNEATIWASVTVWPSGSSGDGSGSAIHIKDGVSVFIVNYKDQ